MARSRVLLLTALLISSCGGAGSAAVPVSTAAPAHVVTAVNKSGVTAVPPETIKSGETVVELGDHWYAPAQLYVTVGTKVTWKQVGSQEHDV
ncbi:MAG TPA: hypothetical protein VM841_05770, partial [Actinomycetota bacterium]|nr:hypothetical protein [Actinomycetota bacterium]